MKKIYVCEHCDKSYDTEQKALSCEKMCISKIDVLDLKFKSFDFDEKMTIREFMQQLLKTLWMREEDFSGKRPFGNSGWQIVIYKCLIENKLIAGSVDEYDVDVDNYDEADTFIIEHIIKKL